ncbi:hypothetical protein ALC60_14528 [Trachymyrmex zeteki]|uniref:Uncharacterized protein n=1 Tax=Mycetomoellerius zeteki TaxID=64791 RepID=A0A151WF34_9HYME|nr:hypothetical protein ALC60_14528 [Trachymyrmex zeteki]
MWSTGIKWGVRSNIAESRTPPPSAPYDRYAIYGIRGSLVATVPVMDGELCRPLNCKKKELCLLEDTFTAVCVSKKELHKSGDIVIPKSRAVQQRRMRTETSVDSDDDDAFFDSEDDDDDQDESK